MQTFLPYPDFLQSAQSLDRQRLGKQRIETLQIIRSALEEYKAWQNHPAVRMWRGHEGKLAEYGLIICKEWTDRGYKDFVHYDIEKYLDKNNTSPPWLGDERLHKSHRSNLTRKYPDYYNLLWTEPNDLPYFWPI